MLSSSPEMMQLVSKSIGPQSQDQPHFELSCLGMKLTKGFMPLVWHSARSILKFPCLWVINHQAILVTPLSGLSQ